MKQWNALQYNVNYFRRLMFKSLYKLKVTNETGEIMPIVSQKQFLNCYVQRNYWTRKFGYNRK